MGLHVTFIRTGNICRSPVAAIIFGGHPGRAGPGDLVEVTSAGTGGWHAGDPADPHHVGDGRGYAQQALAAARSLT
ncbi:hypothetical protein [Saccharothrix sp. BKS2]|uniref:arsenate reductase/protein-tyrosine-phosphatase family protein n=1 Tax=Saccharothrix sp. BKS2 TaxID=3064400 RepID=UPI0039ECF6D3